MSNLEIFHPISIQGGYSVSICSSDKEAEFFKMGISVNDHYLIIICKNDAAIDTLKNWYDTVYRDDNKKIPEKLNALDQLVSEKDKFNLIENQKEAYKEFIQISQNSWESIFKSLPSSKHPPRPDKSFELLKEWYMYVLDVDKKEFLKTSLDNSSEILNTFEIDYIDKLSDKIKRQYFPDPNALRKIAPRLGGEIRDTSKELIASKTFLKWLGERKDELEKMKVSELFHQNMNKPRCNPHKLELLDKLVILSYFKSDNVEISLFSPSNNSFKEIAKLDLEDIRNGEAENNFTKIPHRTNELSLNIIHEAHENEFVILLNDKFNEAQIIKGYKTIEVFSKDETKDLKLRYSKCFGWFPILEQWCGFLEKHKNLPPQESEQKKVQNSGEELENNYTKSTIEDYLSEFKDAENINDSDYLSLIRVLLSFFEKNEIETLPKSLFVKNGNKKRLAFALGEIFKSLKNEPLSFEYLELGKNNISIFKDEQIDKLKYNKSNLYKYYTTKP